MLGDHHQDKLGDISSVWIMSSMSRPRDRVGLKLIVDALRSDRWTPGSGFVKREGGRWVWIGDLCTDSGEVGLVIKGRVGSRFRLIPDRHAIKQAIGAARLHKIGVTTSEPIAMLDVCSSQGVREHWFVLRVIRGETLAHLLARGERSFGDDAQLARRVGALVRTLCEAGLFNRDHKASNLIVLDSGEIGVVDTVAIQRRRPGAEPRRRMLLAMCKELAGIGALPRSAQLLRCLRAASDDVRSDWCAIERSLRDAGDTTPRVNPLRDR